MESNQPQTIDPNTASEQELTEISGIGSELAQRIISERPYQTIDDLSRVSGIGQTFLDRIRPYLAIGRSQETIQPAVEPADEQEAPSPEAPEDIQPEIEVSAPEIPSETGEAEEQETEPEPIILEPVPETEKSLEVENIEIFQPVKQLEKSPSVPPGVQSEEAGVDFDASTGDKEPPTQPEVAPSPAPQAAPGGLSCSQVFWITLVSGLVTVLCAVALSLGILAGLNDGRLQFASPARVNQVGMQIDQLETQLGTLNQDLESVRGRVDNLEGFSGRLSAVEQSLDEVQTNVNQAMEDVQAMNQQVEQLSSEVETLGAQNQRFSKFLDGLRELLSSQLEPEEEAP